MNIRNFKIIKTEKVIGYHNNRITKKCRLVIGHRFGISVLNLIFVKYNLIKLYSLLNNMFTASPALNIFFFSINYNYESFLTDFSKKSIISLWEKWRPNAIKTKRNHLYSWYENEQTSLIYIPDIYNNSVIITEARRSCIPILSLINVHKPITVDYPIFCNIYSFHIVLWFSRYLIRIIQKETNFFRNQHDQYKPYKLRESLKLKRLNKTAFKILECNSYQFNNWKKKIQIWALRKHETFVTRERFYLYYSKKPWKDFWFKRFKQHRQGYKFITMYARFKARLYQYFRKNFIGKKKRTKTLIHRLGRNRFYNWKNHKQRQYQIKLTLDLTRFLHDGMFKEMTKRRISGFFFLVKNKARYIKFQNFLRELFNKKHFNRFKPNMVKNLFYRKDKKLIFFWHWIKKSLEKKKRIFTYDSKHLSLRSQKFFKFYRWEYNNNWLLYTYKKKFKSSNNKFFWYSNIFWSRLYILPVIRKLGESLWNDPMAYKVNSFKNNVFAQRGLVLDINNNINYQTKHLIWTFNFKNFRNNLNNYISTILYKGQLLFLSISSQKERNILWSFKNVIDNEEFIELDWYKNLTQTKNMFSKKFVDLFNILNRFIELQKYIKYLVLLIGLNIENRTIIKKTIRSKGRLQIYKTFGQAYIKKLDLKNNRNKNNIKDNNIKKDKDKQDTNDYKNMYIFNDIKNKDNYYKNENNKDKNHRRKNRNKRRKAKRNNNKNKDTSKNL